MKKRYITPTEDAIVRAAYAWRAAESHKEEIQRLRELRDAIYADLDAMTTQLGPHKKERTP